MDIVKDHTSATTTLDTPWGALHVWSNGPEHVAFRTARHDEPGLAKAITINGVGYTTSVHLHTAAEAAERYEAAVAKNVGYSYQSRPGWTSAAGEWVMTWGEMGHMLTRADDVLSNGTESARTRFLAVVEHIAQWASGPDGQALREQARLIRDQRAREALARERIEVAERLAVIDAELSRLGAPV